MVACMTELLRVNVRSRVLDVGAGSGYQTAVLAELAGEVFALERIAALEEQARERLERMGYDNVTVRLGDGSQGWPEHAPFDGIMVAAAAPEAPPPLLEQLAEGGRLVIPLGDAHRDQILTVYERRGDDFIIEQGLRCRFVPLIGAPAGRPRPAPARTTGWRPTATAMTKIRTVGGGGPVRAVEVRVHGRVQGVWFRASTRIEAQRLGLTGWVRNRERRHRAGAPSGRPRRRRGDGRVVSRAARPAPTSRGSTSRMPRPTARCPTSG